ncbi:RNA recognition motif-containing protein, partial [Spiromyces aspiralis]
EGIPSRATKKHIYKKARKFGEVVRIAYPVGGSEDGEESSASPDSSTKNQVPDGKGTAQITFNKHEEAKVALKRLNNHVFMGAKITASLKPAFENKNYRLIVRNLPFKYREHDVEKLFSQHGLVLSVNLPRKYTGGPLRGFAFVQMGSLKDAERCLNEINGKNILGRIIAVDWALSQDKFKELVASHSTKSGADGSDDDDDDDKSEQGNDSDDADEASVKADESSEGEENIEAKDDYNSKENIESDNDTYSSDDDS